MTKPSFYFHYLNDAGPEFLLELTLFIYFQYVKIINERITRRTKVCYFFAILLKHLKHVGVLKVSFVRSPRNSDRTSRKNEKVLVREYSTQALTSATPLAYTTS